MERSEMEKRKDKRFREWNKAVLKPAANGSENGSNHVVNAYTYDISLTGARIYSEQFFAAGSVVRIQVELLRSKQVLRVDAEVKWIEWNPHEDVFEMGVEFLHELSHSILSLLKHLYAEPTGLPSSMSTSPQG
jgi:c-di-GMP-binding flagellar brake protein YcgR